MYSQGGVVGQSQGGTVGHSSGAVVVNSQGGTDGHSVGVGQVKSAVVVNSPDAVVSCWAVVASKNSSLFGRRIRALEIFSKKKFKTGNKRNSNFLKNTKV